MKLTIENLSKTYANGMSALDNMDIGSGHDNQLIIQYLFATSRCF